MENYKIKNYRIKNEIKGEKSMQQAYKAASKLSNKIIEQDDPEGYKFIKDVKESDIILVRGNYDHGEVIFELCEIPFSIVEVSDVEGIELRDDQIIFVNCPGYIPERGLERIKSFVERGGMLVTTDWALTNVLEKIFPKIIKYNNIATADDVVRVVFENENDTFLNGLLNQSDEPLWWLEGSSYPIKILDTDKVKLLVSSKEMAKKYGENPIVVTFEVGEGKVYHMTSHFYLQRSESRSQRQKQGGSSYAMEKGIDFESFSEEEKQALEGSNLGSVESAYTSTRTLSNIIMEQKKRVSRRKSK